VQFHPAYSYEDFIEGIRPQVIRDADGGSSVDYPLVRGSFAAFCDRALLDPHGTYVFVIDEINRAQVAAVFGELMLALEYRGREVQLAHARGPAEAGEARGLVVPPNILLLGTMNTADRTTALVDHALRRRFAFYPLFPDDSSLVRPMFQSWLLATRPTPPGLPTCWRS
jgi:5-methylcytosine-specific restriction protein B